MTNAAPLPGTGIHANDSTGQNKDQDQDLPWYYRSVDSDSGDWLVPIVRGRLTEDLGRNGWPSLNAAGRERLQKARVGCMFDSESATVPKPLLLPSTGGNSVLVNVNGMDRGEGVQVNGMDRGEGVQEGGGGRGEEGDGVVERLRGAGLTTVWDAIHAWWIVS